MSIENKIPKIIHYCWFGRNPLPELAQKCMASWRKYCPDYEIIEWNEDNFDTHCCAYVEEAYEAKRWAFVSDVARLYALVKDGGIYMDTDVEVLKPLDELLKYEAVSGFENDTQIPTGLMAACKGQKLFAEFLHEYDYIHFKRSDGSLDLTTNVIRITNICQKYGFIANNTFQTLNGFTLLPKDYLCPKDYDTKEVHLTDNTLTIHHFDGSWHTDEDRYYSVLKNKIQKIILKQPAKYIAKFISVIKYRGFINGIKEFFKWRKQKKGNKV